MSVVVKAGGPSPVEDVPMLLLAALLPSLHFAGLHRAVVEG